MTVNNNTTCTNVLNQMVRYQRITILINDISYHIIQPQSIYFLSHKTSNVLDIFPHTPAFEVLYALNASHRS